MQLLDNACPLAVYVPKQAVPEQKHKPRNDGGGGEGVEAEPANVRAGDLVGGKRDAPAAEGRARLARIAEFSRDEQRRRSRPGQVGIDDPARLRIDVVLLRSPEAADAQVQDLAALHRRHAQAAADALRAVVVFGRILGSLVLPAIDEPGHRIEPWSELVSS